MNVSLKNARNVVYPVVAAVLLTGCHNFSQQFGKLQASKSYVSNSEKREYLKISLLEERINDTVRFSLQKLKVISASSAEVLNIPKGKQGSYSLGVYDSNDCLIDRYKIGSSRFIDIENMCLGPTQPKDIKLKGNYLELPSGVSDIVIPYSQKMKTIKVGHGKSKFEFKI